jgi:hypothetical protein
MPQAKTITGKDRTAPPAGTIEPEAGAAPELTDEEREFLEQRNRRREAASAIAELTVRDKVAHSLMRERDHLEGCPEYTAPGSKGGGRVEVYTQTVVSPAPEVRALGLESGDTVTIVRCIECARMRYFAGYSEPDDLIEAALLQRAAT